MRVNREGGSRWKKPVDVARPKNLREGQTYWLLEFTQNNNRDRYLPVIFLAYLPNPAQILVANGGKMRRVSRRNLFFCGDEEKENIEREEIIRGESS